MTIKQIIVRVAFWLSITILIYKNYTHRAESKDKNRVETRNRIEAEFKTQIRDIKRQADTRDYVSEINYEDLTFKYIPESDGKLLLFDIGSSELKLNSIQKIDKFINVLTKNDKVLVEGFTDNTGSRAINQTLSFRRGKSVYEYIVYKLKTLNKDIFEISYVGLGESHPNVPNDSEMGRKLNRRVEITITKHIPDSKPNPENEENNKFELLTSIIAFIEKLSLYIVAIASFYFQYSEFKNKRK